MCNRGAWTVFVVHSSSLERSYAFGGVKTHLSRFLPMLRCREILLKKGSVTVIPDYFEQKTFVCKQLGLGGLY